MIDISSTDRSRISLREALKVRSRVISAVILQDMRTRFGRTHLSYLVAVGWPLAHMGILLGIYLFVTRFAPIGTSTAVFVATGVLPYVLCLYPARMLSTAVMQNRQLLLFPIITTTDLIIARAVVEFLTAFFVALIFLGALTLAEVDVMPHDLNRAIGAALGSVYLGIGLGVINVIFVSLFRMWIIPFVLFMALLYSTAGIVSITRIASEELRIVLSYNPLAHLVIWFRSAYYDGYGDMPLDIGYVMLISTICLFLGILGNKVIRGRVLAP